MTNNKIILTEFSDALDLRYNDKVIICYFSRPLFKSPHSNELIFITNKTFMEFSMNESVIDNVNMLTRLYEAELSNDFYKWENVYLIRQIVLRLKRDISKKVEITHKSTFEHIVDLYFVKIFRYWMPRNKIEK